MNNIIKLNKSVIFISIFFLIISCSTEKNTPLTVGYHNLTAHYNVHFNGYESYNKGIFKIYQTHEDDYSQLLPVYIIPDENMVGSIMPEMDRTQKKAMKVVELHSIKVKREYKNSALSARQREYLKKNEYNRWVDNSYMLIGKSYFYQLNYSLALETFRFVLREFEGEPVVQESRLWIAKTYIEQGNYKEALEILDDLSRKRKMDDKLESELNAVFAQYYIYQEDYDNAISKLTKALKKPGNKINKMRYTFILAQLNQKTGKNKKAYDLYNKLIKMNPPYEMTFNAKINMAGAFEKGQFSSNEIKDQLQKMLKDDKNLDYRDQIYYAIGNIYLKEGKKDLAIENFILSSVYSISNNKQRSRTFITLADIYYDQPDYIKAQAYYDSAFALLNPEFPNYEIIEAKSKNLTELVQSIKQVELQDSIQYLASLPGKERLVIIDNIIAEIEREEREEQLEVQRRVEEMQMARMMNTTNMPDAVKTGSWYFYNPTAKAFGQKEFKTKWGTRKLEDNWRRKNKSIISTDQLTGLNNGENSPNQNNTVLSKKSREYYLQSIPLSDSAMQKSHEIIKESLVNIGLIYKNQFNETELSIAAFEDLIRRYPDDETTLNAYYNLFVIYKETDPSKSNMYKNTIINKYPESKFAKALSNPEYFKEIEKKEKEGPLLYEQTLNLFKQERYQLVINNADLALSKYQDPDLVSKFKYLRALSLGKTSDIGTFRKELNNFINDAGNKELIVSAQKILFFLDSENPENKLEQETQFALEIYEYNPEIEHYIIISVPSSGNINQLVFNIINFNLDNFDKLNLSVESENLEEKTKLIRINPFENQKSLMKYYNDVIANKNIFKDVNIEGTHIFYISTDNYKTLLKDKNIDRFTMFFEANK